MDARLHSYFHLTWYRPTHAEDRSRVVAWTCDCQDTVYELCHAGGQGYLRRMTREDDAVIVHETHRWTFSKTDDWWAGLLVGLVR
ncbi:hypothetical protein [Nonomuraea typhae]|uniref:hypothetical protein n=1 Tax=Nonomuraea typhae TaxID=2603600 RepID=UPI0012FA078B|nr:hypothetical protein [Nonomuraea typhae]